MTQPSTESRIVLHFDKFSAFVEDYASNLSLGGMFLRTDDLRPIGAIVDFKIQLVDGFQLVQGLGEVIWALAEEQDGWPVGMAVRFQALDDKGRELILKVMEEQVKRGEPGFDLDGAPDGAVTTKGADPREKTGSSTGEQKILSDDGFTLLDVDGESPSAPEEPFEELEFDAPWGEQLPEVPDEILEEAPEEPNRPTSSPAVAGAAATAAAGAIALGPPAGDNDLEPSAAPPNTSSLELDSPVPGGTPQPPATEVPSESAPLDDPFELEASPAPAAEDSFAPGEAASETSFAGLDAAEDEVFTVPAAETPVNVEDRAAAAQEALDDSFFLAEQAADELSMPTDSPDPIEPDFEEIDFSGTPAEEPMSDLGGDAFDSEPALVDDSPEFELEADGSPDWPADDFELEADDSPDFAGPADDLEAFELPASESVGVPSEEHPAWGGSASVGEIGGDEDPTFVTSAPADLVDAGSADASPPDVFELSEEAPPAAANELPDLPPFETPAASPPPPDDFAPATEESFAPVADESPAASFAPTPEAAEPPSGPPVEEPLPTTIPLDDDGDADLFADEPDTGAAQILKRTFSGSGKLLALVAVILLALGAAYWMRDSIFELIGLGAPSEPVASARRPPARPPAAQAAPNEGDEASTASEEEPLASPGEEPSPDLETVDVAESDPPVIQVAADPQATEPSEPDTETVMAAAPAAVAADASTGSPATRVEQISWRSVDSGTLITVQLDGDLSDDRFVHSELSYNPQREMVKVLGIVEPYISGQIAVGSSEVQQIRTGHHVGSAGNDLHIVLDFPDAASAVSAVRGLGNRLEILISR